MVAGPLVKEHGSKVGGYYTTVQTKPHKTNTLEQLRQKKTANLTGECKSATCLILVLTIFAHTLAKQRITVVSYCGTVGFIPLFFKSRLMGQAELTSDDSMSTLWQYSLHQ